MPCYPSDNLCDYPVRNKKTCDRLIYGDRSNPIAPTSNIAMRILLNGESLLRMEG